MISNTTTSLEPKSSYTSVEKTKSAVEASGPKAESVPVADVPAKDSPVVAQPSIPERPPEEIELTRQQREELSRKISEAIPKVRELMQKNQRSLDFEVAEEENRVIITVIDKETEKVIRQIPPEDVLQIAESIDQGVEQNLAGFIFSSRV